MKVLLTGGSGQLGQALQSSAPTVIGLEPLELWAPGRAHLDLSDPQACRQAVLTWRPDWVLNAGAYTAVDQAEREPQLAAAINAVAPGALAEALSELQADGGPPRRMLQLSTDFVFDGHQGRPYAPESPVAPLGVYGSTKAAGERVVLEVLGGQAAAHLLRTSWVYGPVGRNFCLTMLRLHRQRAEQGQPLAVVVDQVGCPTSTTGLAAACWRAVSQVQAGQTLPPILHWSDVGVASWFDFALAIGELAQAVGLLDQPAQVAPITTADYPTPAERPCYSLLDCTATRAALGLPGEPWRHALEAVLRQLAVATP